MDPYELVRSAAGFQWDKGNRDKNLLLHGVANSEAEQVFFNEPVLILHDEKHSTTEHRFYALGYTDFGRKLFVAFTMRKTKIRVVSARDMSRKERRVFGR